LNVVSCSNHLVASLLRRPSSLKEGKGKTKEKLLPRQPRLTHPTFSVPSARGDENILKTKVFLTFPVYAHGLLAAYPDLSKVPFYSTLPKKKAARTST
jgi:hypothetical protein